MSSDIEETDEDGNTTTTTETETIHTFTITDDKLISLYEGEKDAEPEISTETDEENGVTITTTDTSENSVAFEYEAETSAILLDSEVDTIESDLSGMDLLLLKKVTVNSESSTTENYEAIDETDETAIAYATEQNETALNETESNIECYEMTYSKGYKRFGRQSAVRVSRISEVVKTDSMVYSDVETHETKHYIFYDDEQRVLSVDVEKDGVTAQQLVYCYTVGQDEFTVNCSHVVDIKNITHIEFDPIYFCGEIPLQLQELSYETTRNAKGQVVKYRYKRGPQYTYEYDEIGTISKIKFDKYTISYNNLGMIEQFYLENQALTDYSYESSFDLSLVTAIAYANGQRIVNEYDETDGKLLSISCGDNQRYTFAYDEDDNVTSVTDILNFRKTEYVETVIAETTIPAEGTEAEGEETAVEDETVTDSTGTDGEENTTDEEPATKRTAFVYDISNAESPVLMYSYDVDGDIQNITLDSVSLNFTIETEDVLDEEGEIESIKTTSVLQNGTKIIQNENLSTAGGNITQTSVIIGGNNILTKKYERDDRARLTKEYAEDDDSTSIEYVYSDENISQINGPYYTTNYLYDSSGQLIEASEDHRYGRARRYNYDNRGNIFSIEGYDNALGVRGELLYTHYLQYNNNWPDQLTSYNGREITYDASGNLLTYNGYTYNWDMGRQLTSITKTDASQILYAYDEDGLRTSKTVNGVTTKFIYDTTLLKAEYTDDYSILFWYDENNSPIGFVYTDKTVETPISQTFIYEKNIFGDIKAIYDETGRLAVSYVFDEFGCIIDAYWLEEYYNIFQINPLLYRGYYYDYETGYYYLSTRYYNPNWGRFISPDDVRYIGASGNYLGINAYAYCEGNPVMYIDPNATAPQKYYIRKAEELKITKAEKDQIMDYAWNVDSVGFPPKIVFTKYCEYKGKLTNKQTTKPYITYTYSKSSSWRGGTDWFTKYVFMNKKVKEWKKVVSFKNYYNPKLLNNIFTEAIDIASNDYYAPDELSTRLSALSTILTLADKIYERSCSKVHRNKLSKYVENHIKGKKDNQSVSLLMKYDTYLHSRKLFSKKYKTENISSHWMY